LEQAIITLRPPLDPDPDQKRSFIVSQNDRQQQRKQLQNARQVLAGDAVRPSPDPWVMNDRTLPLTLLQRNYLVILALLLIVGAVLVWLTGLGIASVVLFILAVALIGGWLIF
jgi:hypothetical protein